VRVGVVILPQFRWPEARARWVPAYTSFGAFTDAAARATELGFTDVVVHWPRPSGPYAGGDALLDAIAGTLVDGAWSDAR
jgi:hypothetical protein